MRPTRQLKIITSHLEVLTDFKKQVDELLNYVSNVMKRAESWVEEKEDNQTFMEINQLLADETNTCIQKCLKITSENQELLHQNGHNEMNSNLLKVSSSVSSVIGEKQYQSLIGRLDEMDKTISSLIKTTQSSENKYSTLKESFESLNDVAQVHAKKIKSLHQKQKNLDKENEAVSQRHEAVFNSNNLKIEEFMRELSAASNFIQEETDSFTDKLNEMENKLNTMSKTVDPLNQNYEDISAAISKSIMLIEPMVKDNAQSTKVFNERITDLDNKIEDISSQVKALSVETNKIVLCDQMSCSENVNVDEIEIDIQALLSESNNESHQGFSTTVALNGVSSKQIVDKNVQVKVAALDSKMQEISSQIDSLLKQNLKISIPTAFNARVKDEKIELNLSKDQILTCFDGVMYNIGKGYNPDTGIFTSPCDGFYLCSLLVDVNVDENLQFGIKRKAKGSGKEFLLATTHTQARDSMVCDIGIVDLYKDDQLFVRPHNNYNKVKLSTYSHFLCILLNKY